MYNIKCFMTRRTNVKKNSLKILFLLLVIFLPSCGYRIGSLRNPQIKTIAIAPITNETHYPDVSEYMRQGLSEQFQFDGSYQVKGEKEADCILYGRVTNITISAPNIRAASGGGVTYMSNVYSVSINFEFTIIIPGRAEPLVGTTVVAGTATYQVPIDQFAVQENGIKQACRNAAQSAVSTCTEVW